MSERSNRVLAEIGFLLLANAGGIALCLVCIAIFGVPVGVTIFLILFLMTAVMSALFSLRGKKDLDTEDTESYSESSVKKGPQ